MKGYKRWDMRLSIARVASSSVIMTSSMLRVTRFFWKDQFPTRDCFFLKRTRLFFAV